MTVSLRLPQKAARSCRRKPRPAPIAETAGRSRTRMPRYDQACSRIAWVLPPSRPRHFKISMRGPFSDGVTCRRSAAGLL